MEPEVALWTTAPPVELDRMITQRALTIGASIAKIEQDDDRTTERVLRDSQQSPTFLSSAVRVSS
jgi:hypothetical protein